MLRFLVTLVFLDTEACITQFSSWLEIKTDAAAAADRPGTTFSAVSHKFALQTLLHGKSVRDWLIPVIPSMLVLSLPR